MKNRENMIKEAKNTLKDVSYEDMKGSWKIRERLIEEAAEEEIQLFTGPMKLAYIDTLSLCSTGRPRDARKTCAAPFK